MKHPGAQYGLILTRQNSYIDLTTPSSLFDGKRPFTLFEWSDKINRYIPWILFTGSKFIKLRDINDLLIRRHNKKDIPMLAMNKFFKDFEDLKNWLGDYFVLFVDDLMHDDK